MTIAKISLHCIFKTFSLMRLDNDQKQSLEVFSKKGVLKISQISQENTCIEVSF